MNGLRGAPPPGLAVGIDVVDLDDPRSPGKSRDARFLDRILAPGEVRQVREARDPDLVLWALWAAKEAGFKVATLLRGRPPVFEHAAFEVRLAGGLPDGPAPESPRSPSPAPVLSGRISYQELDLPLRVLRRGPCLVALSWSGQGGAPGGERLPTDLTWGVGTLTSLSRELEVKEATLEELVARRFHEDEARAVRSLPSALVRLAARRAAASALETDEERLSVICAEGEPGRTPPALHLDGGPCAAAAVSLSHHGHWVGWALRASADGSGAAG